MMPCSMQKAVTIFLKRPVKAFSKVTQPDQQIDLVQWLALQYCVGLLMGKLCLLDQELQPQLRPWLPHGAAQLDQPACWTL